MLKKFFIGACVVMLLSDGAAFAGMPSLQQFGFGKPASGSTASPALAELNASKDKLTGTYVQSTQMISDSLAKIASSFGLGNDLVAKLAPVKALVPASLSDSAVSASRQAIDLAAQMLIQKLQGTQTLTPQAKASFQSGLATLVNGIQTVKGLIPQAGSLADQAKGLLANAPVQEKLSAQGVLSTALSLAKNLPADMGKYSGILSTLVQFAKAQNISVPQIANMLLSGK